MKEVEKVVMIPVELIEEPGHQLRETIDEDGLEELKKSMVKVGLINAVTVRPKGEGFEIKSGHRRFLAALDLGWKEIKCVIREGDDQQTEEEAIHENFHREEMTPMEEGRALKKLIEKYGYTKKDAAKVCSKSEGWVGGRLLLLDMPENIRAAVDSGAIGLGVAKELCGITLEADRDYYLDNALRQGATTELVRFWRSRWELNQITHKPGDLTPVGAGLMAAPTEVLLACQWCDEEVPISLINHLRVCPKCTGALIQTKQLMRQQAFEEAKGGNGGKGSGS